MGQGSANLGEIRYPIEALSIRRASAMSATILERFWAGNSMSVRKLTLGRSGRRISFLRDEGDEGAYFGFPAIGVDGVKIGKHTHLLEPIDPNQPNPEVNGTDEELLDSFAAKRLPSVATVRMQAVICRYTMLPSEDFLIDHLPETPAIIVCSECSGHGFKFTSVIRDSCRPGT